MAKRKATLGTVMESGNGYRARYMRDNRRHTPGHTFSTEAAAWAWLRAERTLMDRDTWTPPADRRSKLAEETQANTLTLDAYARRWIENRVTPKGTPLHPRTRSEYLAYLDGILKPLAAKPLAELTAADVARWHAEHPGTPSLRHKAYSFAKSVMRTAVEVEELAPKSPFMIENAGRKPETKKDPDKAVKGLDHDKVREVAGLVQPRDRVLILLLAYCCLRTGEACALRRRHVEMGASPDGVPFGWLTVEHAISTHGGQRHEGPTKTGRKGERVIPIPPHLLAAVTEHLGRRAEPGPDGLLFPSTNPEMAFRTTQQITGHAALVDRRGVVRKPGYGFYHARIAAGVPDLRLHWLRHWGATLWAEAGTPESMRRAILGHAQHGMTGSYTHPDTTKADVYALRVSELAGWTSGRSSRRATGEPSTPLLAVLQALDDATLTTALAGMGPAQVAGLVPQLPPERLAAVLAGLAGPRPALRVVDGGGR